MKVKVGIVSDNELVITSLSVIINRFETFEVIPVEFNADNLSGNLAAQYLQPEILLIDSNSVKINGIETIRRIRRNHPDVKLTAISTKADEADTIKMLMGGCCAFLYKELLDKTLEYALKEIYKNGYYNADIYKIIRMISCFEQAQTEFNEREKKLLELACSDLTYKEIGVQMYLSERTIKANYDVLFDKLEVRSRAGLVLEAIRQHFVSINNFSDP
jgi:DNA-binding NarL/FixJ family response regulator